MLKAAKKLKKLWTRKKTKRKKTSTYYDHYSSHLPPTSTSRCCCSCNYHAPVQPSAPPLPPWLEPKHNCGTVFAELAGSAYPTETQQVSTQEVVVDVETNSNVYPSLQSSYQQYTVPDPVYGVPLVQAGRRERSAGFYGCIISYVNRIIRCFCPCLQIRQAREIVL